MKSFVLLMHNIMTLSMFLRKVVKKFLTSHFFCKKIIDFGIVAQVKKFHKQVSSLYQIQYVFTDSGIIFTGSNIIFILVYEIFPLG